MFQTASTDRQKLAARLVLAFLASLLVALVAVTGPNGVAAFAQTAPSTSPTPTPTSQTIELINPSENSFEVSEKPDGKDAAYHIVAAVGIVPTNAIVEFELTEVTATGTAGTVLATYPSTRVANTDTFEFFWETSDTFDDGEYILRAILFSGSRTEIDRDEQTIQINNRGPDPTALDEEAQAETVEITYPLNAGPLGIFRGAVNGGANFVMDFTASGGTTFVTGFYSTQAPGSPPAFTACANGALGIQNTPASATPPPRAGTYRCRLAAADVNRPVTAVSLVPNDSPRANNDNRGFSATNDDSSDGHRVFSYGQTPGNVRITPFQQSKIDAGTCAPTMTVTVVDQFERQIAGQNVDIHAIGPSDQLRFDTDSDAFQRPEGGGHTEEPAFDCSDGATDTPNQGEHNLAGGPDRKHIESTDAGGTNDTGAFRFRLFSDSAGTTQIVAWADSTNDDVCVSEKAGAASIGWGPNTIAPTPSGDQEASTCSFSAAPSPTPSNSTSPTQSPSPTNTTSTSPSPTNTTSTSPSPSNTTSTSPSPTNTVSPQPDSECEDGADNDGDGFTDFGDDPSCSSAEDDSEAPVDENIDTHSRTLQIDGFKHVQLPGNRKPALRIKGQVLSNDGFTGCEAQVPVKVQIRAGGEWITRKSDTTNDNGVFKVLIRDVPGRYRAVATKFQITDPNNSNQTDVCLKAKDTARHRH